MFEEHPKMETEKEENTSQINELRLKIMQSNTASSDMDTGCWQRCKYVNKIRCTYWKVRDGAMLETSQT